jgi:hypothetical protein
MRSTRTRLTGLAGLACLAIVTTACTASAGKNPAGTPTASVPRGAATPAPSAPPVAASPDGAVPASPDAWLAVGRTGEPGLEVILATTRERMLALPTGVPLDAEWGHMITAEATPGGTVVHDLVVQPGFGGDTTRIEGSWRLPTIGPDPVPVGVASNGPTIILAENVEPGTDSRTRFALLSRGFPRPARILALPGRFDYDTLSPDGTVLYVIEHLDEDAGGRYQVRAVDLPGGTLRDGIIVSKTNIEEGMAGYPLAQLRNAAGGVLTLYRGPEHPFIHALNSVEGWAICIDLPATGAHDAAAAADWGLAQAPDGHTAYAVNATLGLVAEVNPTGDFGVWRETTVQPLAGSGIVLAKFGHQESGPTGRRVVVAPDGRTIYAAGAGGVLAIDASSLKVRGTFQRGAAVDALAVTPDGGTLYALLGDGGRIVKLDSTTGDLLGTVPGDGYDRLVAVVPW